MNIEPLISVIIPVYNTAAYLDKCIKSVLEQTYKSFEIILVDDESPDNAPIMCDKYAKSHKNITVIHKPNEGLGLTRNAGLNVAKGDFVCFLDSDDSISEDTFAGCINSLVKEGADACYFGRRTQKSDGTVSVNSNIPLKLVYTNDEVVREFAARYFGQMPDESAMPYIQASACCSIYRRSVIEDNCIRFVSERQFLSEDTFFNLDFCRFAKKIIIIPEDYYFYTYNPGSLTKRYNPNRFNQLKGFCEKIIEYKEYFEYSDSINVRLPFLLYVYLRHSIEYEVKSYKINGLCKTYFRIKEICNDSTVSKIVDLASIIDISNKRKLLIKLIKYRMALFIMLIYIVK